MKGMWVFFVVMLAGIFVGTLWNSVPAIKDNAHAILDPSVGALLNWNVSWGMVIITAVLTIIITLLQKYTTDQETLRQLKKEQKLLNEEMKKFKDHPEKMMELQKKSLEFIPKTMDITMRPLMYTAIPIILFFRWFSDFFFVAAGASPIKIFGFFSWFWAYLLLSIIFSMIFRKVFKVV